MKAIYKHKLCNIEEMQGDTLLLEPIDDSIWPLIEVDLGDPGLIIDPTDDEVAEVRGE